MIEVDRADDDGGDARCCDRGGEGGGGIGCVTRGERLFDEHSGVVCAGGFERGGVFGVGGVEFEHDGVGELGGEASAGERFRAHADGADEALVTGGLELGEDVVVVDDVLVAAVGMDEDDVEAVGAEALEGAFDGSASGACGEVEGGLTAAIGRGCEGFADLGGDDPAVAVSSTSEDGAEPFFGSAVGRGGIECVDAEFVGDRDEIVCMLIGRDGEVGGVLHALVSSELDGAEREDGAVDAGDAERPAGEGVVVFGVGDARIVALTAGAARVRMFRCASTW